MRILSWAATDRGQRRERNEDAYLCNEGLSLYAVADGMGGHAGGEIASRMTVMMLEAASGEGYGLAEAIRLACRALYGVAERFPALEGMGTTCTAVACQGGAALVGHVGDSRAYLLRDAAIRLLTEDHTLVNAQIKAGLISVEEARSSRYRNIITRSVGFDEDVAVDSFTVPLQEGDYLLLCSDGLSGLVGDDEMLEVVSGNRSQEVPDKLVGLANDRGGDDNITVVLLYVDGGEDGSGEVDGSR